MPVLDEKASAAPSTDLEFVLQQLAALQPMAVAENDAGCKGCNGCSIDL